MDSDEDDFIAVSPNGDDKFVLPQQQQPQQPQPQPKPQPSLLPPGSKLPLRSAVVVRRETRVKPKAHMVRFIVHVFVARLELTCLQVYRVEVEGDKGSWAIYRRYNDFNVLEQLVRAPLAKLVALIGLSEKEAKEKFALPPKTQAWQLSKADNVRHSTRRVRYLNVYKLNRSCFCNIANGCSTTTSPSCCCCWSRPRPGARMPRARMPRHRVRWPPVPVPVPVHHRRASRAARTSLTLPLIQARTRTSCCCTICKSFWAWHTSRPTTSQQVTEPLRCVAHFLLGSKTEAPSSLQQSLETLQQLFDPKNCISFAGQPIHITKIVTNQRFKLGHVFVTNSKTAAKSMGPRQLTFWAANQSAFVQILAEPKVHLSLPSGIIHGVVENLPVVALTQPLVERKMSWTEVLNSSIDVKRNVLASAVFAMAEAHRIGWLCWYFFKKRRLLLFSNK